MDTAPNTWHLRQLTQPNSSARLVGRRSLRRPAPERTWQAVVAWFVRTDGRVVCWERVWNSVKKAPKPKGVGLLRAGQFLF